MEKGWHEVRNASELGALSSRPQRRVGGVSLELFEDGHNDDASLLRISVNPEHGDYDELLRRASEALAERIRRMPPLNDVIAGVIDDANRQK